MSDDYLWDGSGPPDPDVERLEQMLGRLRTTAPMPELPDRSAGLSGPRIATLKGSRYVSPRFLIPTLAAAASIAAMLGVAWQTTRATRSWEVERMAGQPRIDGSALAGIGRLGVGETLVTDASSRARLDVSSIGQATIDTGSRVRLVDTREGHHQLALERGTLHAFITAPPGQFVVDTPSATATDLGCVYTLHVDEDGSGTLSVVAGWVAFEFNGRESFVPAGASSRTDPRLGPGTPRYDDATQAFKEALDDMDGSADPVRHFAALKLVLEEARERDAMTLWHLIPRVGGKFRALVVEALAARVPMPAGVSGDAVMNLDKAALDQWWDALGLRDASWWRKWKGPYPATSK
jgi:FecR protein